MKSNQEQDYIIKEKWIPFLTKYCKCEFVSLEEKAEPNKYSNTENVYEVIFDHIIKPIGPNEVKEPYNIKFKFEGSDECDEWQTVENNSWGHLDYVCKGIKSRYKQEDGYWRCFPNWAIAGYIFGFFSVISWVGMGYFANALRSATDGESKFNVFINSLAGIFDTVACGFILYSLIVGAPMFSIPMIIAAAVSVLLRVICTVCIFNNIYENKKSIAKSVYMDQILGDIEKFLEQYKPKEVPEPDNGVKEFQEKPKEQINENEKNGGDNKEEIGKKN